MPIRFNEHNKVYNLVWTELLQTNEIPFASFEDIGVGTEVMAPWQHRGKVSYSEAVVVESCASKSHSFII